MPERTELFYDDGVAQPEFYYDRDWPLSTGRACAELAGVLSFIFFTFGGIAYVIGDSYRPVRRRCPVFAPPRTRRRSAAGVARRHARGAALAACMRCATALRGGAGR